MPVTSGHGNPNWSREEVILALELYNRVKPNIPSGKDSRVIALSNLLRKLNIHPQEVRKASFRNPDSVAFKLQNLYSLETGKGLSNTAKTDREVWGRYGTSPIEVDELSTSFRAASDLLGIAEDEAGGDDEDIEYTEGRLLYRVHRRRERSGSLRKKALAKWRSKGGVLRCGLCEKEGDTRLGKLGDSIFDVHHLRPLFEVGLGKTKIEDLALLCANCHRLMHRVSARDKKWYQVSELRELVS